MIRIILMVNEIRAGSRKYANNFAVRIDGNQRFSDFSVILSIISYVSDVVFRISMTTALTALDRLYT